jgi:thiamine-phosphate diphosphorylase
VTPLFDRRPALALVTDGTRLAPGGSVGGRIACLVAQVRFAVAAGIDLVQLREPSLEAGDLYELTRAAVGAARGSGTRVLVNDRLDVALAAGADGVHLRADSVPPRAAKSLAPRGFLIGRSVHDVDEALEAAEVVDYLIAGTVFPTPSKPGVRLLGLEGLGAMVRRTGVPVLAIGGVTLDRVTGVAEAGVAGVAAIGLFMPSDGVRHAGCRAAPLDEVCAAVRERFDRARTAS